MSLFSSLDVSASGMAAQRTRAELLVENMANAETTRTAAGGPYQRQHVVFTSEAPQQSFASQLMGQAASADAQIGGVRVSAVVADQGGSLRRFDPGHPDADKDGFVSYPDINPLTEMVDLMGATRAYGLNSSAVQAEKGMVAASLDILK